ncbi:MAG: copper amine oxidase N-terminal domain-containing protein [Candidatus Eremiobacteraeota bacterium]|nr:copper amine oxidase N-terminal domain-containing protein [Candidatus Eremiobacteraeota bacterium]MBC5803307.1 copper amine oxidase N-terminal domain-containing protein [Candidatus Eremiobacteraeota bacterium]MBC5822914.1 copper amine oxidase N-terminal domain-containing protein [Candidatus Eremiobacteraeota bacterium]
MRKTTHGAIALAFIVCLTSPQSSVSAAAAAPPIYVNGEPTNSPAIVRGGQAFVPVRGVFQKLDAVVTYTPPGSVVASKGNADLVRLTVGSRAATVNGAPRTLATAPFLSAGRAFVPLRLISEAAGASVAYSAAPHVVRIVSPHAAAVAAAPATSATPVAHHDGIPWWVWLLVALAVLALLFALLRRRKPEPTISTRSSVSDPTIRRRS